ncbi:DinB family protein [Nonomuraea sp. LPB2021202275-12-8]|uniref:DinB family protein n=1 Tax=Nonomuraea sp. LPB2021202275-12-8 TaxID=3120159 RepID=UPI00300D759A
MTEKELLRATLREFRDAMVWKLEGLGDADMRMPMTPTGTNLLGLVKHLAGLEYGYLGEVFGRPAPERMSWIDDDSIWEGADMWVAPGESTDYIVGLYRRACAHADETIEALELSTVGTVPWWEEGKRDATLRQLILRMIGETARHAGHADIVRELLDGAGGRSPGDRSFPADADPAWWREYVGRIRDSAATAPPDASSD